MSECTVDEIGTKFWIQNGRYHREDGPAIEWYDGTKEWFLNGRERKIPKADTAIQG